MEYTYLNASDFVVKSKYKHFYSDSMLSDSMFNAMDNKKSIEAKAHIMACEASLECFLNKGEDYTTEKSMQNRIILTQVLLVSLANSVSFHTMFNRVAKLARYSKPFLWESNEISADIIPFKKDEMLDIMALPAYKGDEYFNEGLGYISS